MKVRCSLCGGENEIQPGQRMLSCAYCGSALAVDGMDGPEHLILPHERSDRLAREALRSFLLSRQMTHPKDIKVDFAYIPYLLIEDEKGRTSTVSGVAKAPAGTGVLPYPPAGCYRFFDVESAGTEKVVPARKVEKGTTRLLHLPVYRMRYEAGGSTYRASAIGESWQVYADELPPEKPSVLNMQNVLLAAVLLVAYLFLGTLGHGWLSRFVITFAAAAAGLVFMTLRKRMVKNG